MAIGDLYNASRVKTGQAAGYFAPVNTAPPADALDITAQEFNAVWWLGQTITPAASYTITVGGSPTSTLTTSSTLLQILAALVALAPVGAGGALVGGTLAAPRIAFIGNAAGLVATVSAGTITPAAPWQAFGSTEQGWQVNYNVNTNDINIEEQQTPVDRQVTDGSLQFVANLSEDTVTNMAVAYNATKTVTAAGTGQPGKTVLTLNASLTHLAVAVETENLSGLKRIYYAPDMVCAVNVGVTFRRAASQRLIPVTFTSTCPLPSISISEYTAVGT